MPQFVCPGCKKTLSMAQSPPVGRAIVCPACKVSFVPVPAAAAAAPIALAPPPPPPPPPPAHNFDDEDEGPQSYTVQAETEEEKRLAEAAKVKFGNVRDKFAKSKRGPAMSLLVLPANLMVVEGVGTFLLGIALTVIGFWPLVFTDSTPSDEELVDALYKVFIGIFAIAWGSLICRGAAQMQNLGSYSWAVASAILALLPLLVGVFALVALYDPRVIEGFKEPDSGPIKTTKDDDEEEEEDDDDDEDDRKKKKRRKK